MRLKLSNILPPDYFKLNVAKNCYQPIQPIEIYNTLEFQITLPETSSQELMMIAMTYNSTQSPNLTLVLNHKTMNRILFTSNTYTDDKILSQRIEEGPFYFQKGKNFIKLSTESGFPDIYAIEIYPFVNNINKVPSDFSYRMSDFILIESYNIYGGFFWHLNNFLMCSHFAENFKKIPIVNFDRGLFINNTSVENDFVKENPNWFFNYFQYYTDIPPSVYQSIINHPKRNRIDIQAINNYQKYKKFADDNKVLEFKREAFLWVQDNYYQNKSYRELIPKYLKPLPHILKKKLEVKAKYLPKRTTNHFYIGVHYRGTDKIEEELNPEQNPKHYSYHKIYELLVHRARKVMEEKPSADIYIVACSDEQPFLDFLKQKLNRKLIYYPGATRSRLDTSNLQEDFTSIPNRNMDVDLVGLGKEKLETYKKRKQLIDNCIHLGNKNVSNYTKGLDCLLDCYMLEDVDILYKSKGNFSYFIEYLNQNPNLVSYNIHEELEE